MRQRTERWGLATASALAVLAVAVSSTFFVWPTASEEPEGWSLVALGLVVTAMATVVGRRGALAPWTATACAFAALCVLNRAWFVFQPSEPGPAVFLGAALLGLVVGASTLRSVRPAPPAVATLRRMVAVMLVVGLVVGVRFGRHESVPFRLLPEPAPAVRP